MGGTPEVNLSDEWLQWESGTRMEAASPYTILQKTIYDPVITSDPIIVGFFLRRAHVTDFFCYLDGSDTPSITFSIKWGTDITAAGTSLIPDDSVCNTTTVSTKSIAYGNIPQENFLFMTISNRGGTVHSITVCAKVRTRV